MIGNCMIHIDYRPPTRRTLNRQQIRISARAPSNQIYGPEPPKSSGRRPYTVYRCEMHRQMIGNCIIYIDHLPSIRRILSRQQICTSARAPCNQISGNPLTATAEDHMATTAARSIAIRSEIAFYVLTTYRLHDAF